MKKAIMALIFIVAFSYPVLAENVQVTKEIQSQAVVNTTLNAVINIKPPERINSFDIVEMIPSGWHIEEWKINNYDPNYVSYETFPYNYKGVLYSAYHWSLNKSFSNQVQISYSMRPMQEGNWTLTTIWLWPENFGTSSQTLYVYSAPPIPIPPEKFNVTMVYIGILAVIILVLAIYRKAIILNFKIIKLKLTLSSLKRSVARIKNKKYRALSEKDIEIIQSLIDNSLVFAADEKLNEVKERTKKVLDSEEAEKKKAIKKSFEKKEE